MSTLSLGAGGSVSSEEDVSITSSQANAMLSDNNSVEDVMLGKFSFNLQDLDITTPFLLHSIRYSFNVINYCLCCVECSC